MSLKPKDYADWLERKKREDERRRRSARKYRERLKERSAGPGKANNTRAGRLRRRRKTNEKFARQYHSIERVKWVQSLRCAHCNAPPPSQNAHIKTGGMGMKAGYRWIVPLCAKCHQDRVELRNDFSATAEWVQKTWEERQ